MVKNLPASTGEERDVGSIPGLGSPVEKEMATHSSMETHSHFLPGKPMDRRAW